MVTWDGMNIDIKEGLVKKYSQLHNVSKTSHLHCLKCVVYERELTLKFFVQI